MQSHHTTKKNLPLSVRFWKYVDKSDECWLWTGALSIPPRPGHLGYGWIRIGGRKGRTVKAHRVSWELAYGPIPEGKIICHHCDNPPCVRPDHLFIGTRVDNVRDMLEKDRARGPVKLTAQQRREISEEYTGKRGEFPKLAARYGVTKQAIFWIVKHSR